MLFAVSITRISWEGGGTCRTNRGVLVKKSERNGPVRRPDRELEDNIKKQLTGILCVDV